MKDLYVVVLVREVTDLEEKSLRRAKWGTEAPNHWISALRMYNRILWRLWTFLAAQPRCTTILLNGLLESCYKI